MPVAHAAHSPERPLGFLVAEVPAERFTAIMTDNQDWLGAGLGATGEAFLVAEDGRLITALRPSLTAPEAFVSAIEQSPAVSVLRALDPQQSISGRLRVSTAAVEAALGGEAGMGVVDDYLGRPMLTAWTPLELGQHRFALITQQAPEEVYGPLRELRREVMLSVAVAVALVSALALFASLRLASFIGRPLRELALAIHTAAKARDLRHRFGSGRRDEVGMIGLALDELFQVLEALIGRIGGMAHRVADSAANNAVIGEQCRMSVHEQRSSLGELGQTTDEVAEATGRIAQDMAAAARAGNSAAALAEGGRRQVGDVARLMEQLAGQISASGQSVAALQSAVADIDTVLATIRGVAEQTNLLALNAAIEAARAGEQGRGFAVVADEVRALAGGTERATCSIQTMVQRLQTSMHEVAGAIAKEHEGADRCVAQADEAVAALAAIEDAVATIRTTSTRVAEATECQHSQTEAIRARLSQVLTEADRTDQAMAQLATIAGNQQSMAAELERAAQQFQVGGAVAASVSSARSPSIRPTICR
ncbi:hypothetical protein CAI21_10095 [Alkalilimnicola ehrlichii]|uniref:methyl-accepting chemotaxis protein n=1 Tax=Alkalilimnicola ehrlichii TaxID=351052 RepID=UPI000E2E4DBB|nr:methyl-accepting chemotaxis protein [Alkalilimnicola ehrlichii]RFA29401.1 hypothetical protein CAI21_10095 [Alkalilimnicola ehrlichii]